MENSKSSKPTESEYVRQGAIDAFRDVIDTTPKIKRSWDPLKIKKHELPDYIKYDPILWQFFRRLHYQNKNFICLIVGEPGCQPAGSKVLMSNGEFKNIEDVKVGDRVLTTNLKFQNIKDNVCNVINVYRKLSTSIYHVKDLNGNLLYKCGGSHLIPIKKNKNIKKNKILIISAEDLFLTKKSFFSGKFTPLGCELVESVLEKHPGEEIFGIEVNSCANFYITDNHMITHNSGKSLTAIQLARKLDITPLGDGKFKENWKLNQGKDGRADAESKLVFGPSDFLRLIKSGLSRGSIIVWDEAGVGNDATKWNDRRSQLIKHIMQTFRSRNYGIFLTVPDKESVTLATRRLVHCYIDVFKRNPHHAEMSIVWLKRERAGEKTKTYYKRPIFVDPISGMLKKVFVYKVPKIAWHIEDTYNKIKDCTLQNLYEFYQREMEIMDKELGVEQEQGLSAGKKLKKFNMSSAVEICNEVADELLGEDFRPSEAKICLRMSNKGYDCSKQQAKLVAELINQKGNTGMA